MPSSSSELKTSQSKAELGIRHEHPGSHPVGKKWCGRREVVSEFRRRRRGRVGEDMPTGWRGSCLRLREEACMGMGMGGGPTEMRCDRTNRIGSDRLKTRDGLLVRATPNQTKPNQHTHECNTNTNVTRMLYIRYQYSVYILLLPGSRAIVLYATVRCFDETRRAETRPAEIGWCCRWCSFVFHAQRDHHNSTYIFRQQYKFRLTKTCAHAAT